MPPSAPGFSVSAPEKLSLSTFGLVPGTMQVPDHSDLSSIRELERLCYI